MTPDTAVLFGAVVATSISAITVILAFLRPAMRWAVAVLSRREASFADQLCAGIWLSAVGATIVGATRMVWLTFDVVIQTCATIGWCFIGAGYFLHFTAWRSSWRGDAVQLSHWRWAFILVTLGIGAAVTVFLLLG